MVNKKIHLELQIHFQNLCELVYDYSYDVRSAFALLNDHNQDWYKHPLCKCMGFSSFDINSDISKWLIEYDKTGILTDALKNYILSEIEGIMDRDREERKKVIDDEISIKKEKQEGYIYVIKNGKFYKIGRAKRPKERMKTYKTESPNEIEVILCKKVDDYVETEKALLTLFEDKQHRGEWFELDDRDITKIRTILK